MLLAVLPVGCGGERGAGTGMAAAGSRHTAAPVKEVEVAEDPVKTGIAPGDAGLAGKVRSRLAADPLLRRLPIDVDAEEGRVTLWGHVESAGERAAVERLARETPGVTSVVDHVKVGEKAGSPGRPGSS